MSTDSATIGVSRAKVLGVSQLTALIKEELDANFYDVWVEGELSGVKVHTSGHCYFTLKDAGAQLSCALFRSQLAQVRFRLQDGMKVLIRGGISVYEPRGTYSLNVRQIEPKGVGDLQLAFEQLKAKLAAEGLFDKARKRPIPFLCQRIGLVTSPTGAVIRDMLTVMGRRNPLLHIVLSPAKVQGAGAAAEIVRGISRLNALGNLDVIIVGRGGGSIEDLYCFNEEAVARAIASSAIPVVSAVGHETDVTIADFVADLRAPTPSAAAELVVKERSELLGVLSNLDARLGRVMQREIQDRQMRVLGLSERLRDPRRRILEQRIRLEGWSQRLNRVLDQKQARARTQVLTLDARLSAQSPVLRLAGEHRQLELLKERVGRAFERGMDARRERLGAHMAHLDAVSPLSILARGYALARRDSDERVLRGADDIDVGERLRLRLLHGELLCDVVEKGSSSDQ